MHMIDHPNQNVLSILIGQFKNYSVEVSILKLQWISIANK